MKLEKLIASLPNGFHDAQMTNLLIDYLAGRITFSLNLLTGDPEDKSKKMQDTYKAAQLIISDFEYCVIDSPDKGYPYLKRGHLNIDLGVGQPATSPVNLPPHKNDSFQFWIWVDEWNSFIRIAAKDVDLKWN